MSQEMSVTWNKDIQELRDKLKLFGTSIGAKYLGSALRKAAEPTYAALKAEVKKRGKVTGNLLRSVKIKVKKYSRTGNAVALIGFGIEARGGGLIEFGTKDRKTKSAFASSFRSKTAGRSGFAIVQNKTNALFVRPIRNLFSSEQPPVRLSIWAALLRIIQSKTLGTILRAK